MLRTDALPQGLPDDLAQRLKVWDLPEFEDARYGRLTDAAVAQLRAKGHEISDEDVARLSPLKHKNLRRCHVVGCVSV
ncbi:hypothetical protein WJ438_40175 [Streptomyces sp. GD-15H]|uniref:hypothetical protein n=1 Tax=Streptomyces sp. GD-15H TaxID=3129112 RepID=UPI00324E99D9